MNSEEFNNGWNSYYLGLDLKDNPHQKDSWAYKEWLEGYLDCKQAQYIIAYSN